MNKVLAQALEMRGFQVERQKNVPIRCVLKRGE
jgi:hypothetical protein